MARIIRLTENDLARIVRRVITEQLGTVRAAGKAVGNNPVKTNATPPPLKTIVFADPSARNSLTNIDILPPSIKLSGPNVRFSYRIAGRPQILNGVFYCSTNNQIKIVNSKGVPFKSSYISNKRAVTLKSKCGTSQGYASTNTGVDTSLA
jgi:hypothetical protein